MALDTMFMRPSLYSIVKLNPRSLPTVDEVWDDGHLVRLGELYAHPLPGAPLSTKASRQSTLGYTHGSSLSVDGAQATNSMVTQDTDKVFIQVRSPCGRNTYVLRLIVLNCVER